MKFSAKFSAMKKLLPALILATLLFAPVCHAIAQQPANVAAADSDGGRMSTPEAQSPEKNQQEKVSVEAMSGIGSKSVVNEPAILKKAS